MHAARTRVAEQVALVTGASQGIGRLAQDMRHAPQAGVVDSELLFGRVVHDQVWTWRQAIRTG